MTPARARLVAILGFLLVAGGNAVMRGPSAPHAAATQAPARPPGTIRIELNGHTFTLPEGFTIELVAGPPLVDRPITAAFDDDGRLYVSDSSGSNDKVDKQLAERPHRIVRLEDSDGDGRFDMSTEFADKMMFPEGTMWFDGSLYVAAPPSIWKLTDTDGDGVADGREEWFAGKTLTGCANDLHGPYLGPDGWIYWAKGAFAKQTYERVGKSLRVIPDAPLNILGKEVPVASSAPLAPAAGEKGRGEGAGPDAEAQLNAQPSTLNAQRTWSTRASHIFRCRPDGSGLEVVMTGGMDNPVDVVFMPGGERIFTTTFLVHPGGGLRDGLIHAVYGGIYGKDHDPIHEPQHKWTGPDTMPVLAHLGGAAAPCGLERYQSRVFGPDYENNLFTACFNMHKVTRHVLTPEGATFKSIDSDFLVSSNLDFHPTDVLEDADGSLLVVDTGGWYKLCCPTSQLQKPDVLGAIYRVRRKDAPKIDDPRGRRLDWSNLNAKELSNLLSDKRAAVRQRAVLHLSKRGIEAIGPLTSMVRSGRAHATLRDSRQASGVSVEAEEGAVWALTRIDHAEARAAAREALSDPSETVRRAAMHAISLHRDIDAAPQLVKRLTRESPFERRVAAEALGRIGDKSAVPALLKAASDTSDRVLEHAVTFALIEIGDRDALTAALHDEDARTRRAALVALDQMNGGGLEPQQVAKLLKSNEPMIKEAAAWIMSRHAEWGGTLVGWLRERLGDEQLSDADRAELVKLLARFAKSADVQALIGEVAGPASDGTGAALSSRSRTVALMAMRDAGLRELPKSWVVPLCETLRGDEPFLATLAVLAARSTPAPKEATADLASSLLRVANSDRVGASDRLDALAAVPGGLASVEPPEFEFLRANLASDRPVAARSAAVDVLAKAKLSAEQLQELAESLKSAGPLEADRLLGGFEQSGDEAVGMKLIESLKGAPALASLRADSLKRAIAKCGPAVQEAAIELFAALNVDVAKQKAKLDELLAALTSGELQPGDIRRGQAVFMSQKAACFSCHQMGYRGGNVGPDLTRIGGIRNERDLLESIVFPSASFVRSYEPVAVATKDGRVFAGFLKKDAPDEIVLAVNATETARIAREDIEEMKPGAVSVMPSGLDQQLSRQDLADLVAFLKAAK